MRGELRRKVFEFCPPYRLSSVFESEEEDPEDEGEGEGGGDEDATEAGHALRLWLLLHERHSTRPYWWS